MSKMLRTFNFEWVKDIFLFNEVFIKNYDGKNEVGYIFEIDVKYPEDVYKPFLPKRKMPINMLFT